MTDKKHDALEQGEAPATLKLWICCHCGNPRLYGSSTDCKTCGMLLHDTASYARVGPPAAPTGDRCTCGRVCPSDYERQTEEAECVHAPDCELMRGIHVAPPAPDEADQALAHELTLSGDSRYFDPSLADKIAAALAQARKEGARKAWENASLTARRTEWNATRSQVIDAIEAASKQER